MTRVLAGLHEDQCLFLTAPEFFCNCHCVQSRPGAHASSYPVAVVGRGHFFHLGLKQMQCDANCLTPPSAEG